MGKIKIAKSWAYLIEKTEKETAKKIVLRLQGRKNELLDILKYPSIYNDIEINYRIREIETIIKWIIKNYGLEEED